MPVEKEVGIVCIVVYTLHTQVHIPPLSLVPTGKVDQHFCSVSVVVQKQHLNSVWFFSFQGTLDKGTV